MVFHLCHTAATQNKSEALPVTHECQILCCCSWLLRQVRVTAGVLVLRPLLCSLCQYRRENTASAVCRDLAAVSNRPLGTQKLLGQSLLPSSDCQLVSRKEVSIPKVPKGQNFMYNVPQKALCNQQVSQKQGISLGCEWKTSQVIHPSKNKVLNLSE